MGTTAELNLDGKPYELPIIIGSQNEKAVDIRKLRGDTGYVTLDSGYENTGACQSKITFIDGDNGILKYRGIPIEVLADKSDFVETSYLLIYGKLPTKLELANFSR